MFLDVRLRASLAVVGAGLSLADHEGLALMAGWGGKRTGSGRKPKPKPPVSPFAVVQGGRTLEAAFAGVTEPDRVLATPPVDLPAEQQAFWATHAPLALERGTLTAATVPTFRILCELHVKKVYIGAMVDKGALGGLRVFLQLAKQVEGLMGRFCLAPFGKPLTVDKPKAAANPFAQVSGQ